MDSASRISRGTGIAMIAAAVAIDALQIGADVAIIGFFVDTVLDGMAAIFFGIWFSHNGVSFAGKYPLGFWGALAVEAIPGINALPVWSFAVIRAVQQEWAQKNSI